MIFKIDQTNYQIEFHHINKRAKRHMSKMHYVEGIYAITTCAVIVDGGKRVSLHNTFCSDLDNFSYEKGRVEALTGALDRLGRNIDRKQIPLVLEAYHRRNEREIGMPLDPRQIEAGHQRMLGVEGL